MPDNKLFMRIMKYSPTGLARPVPLTKRTIFEYNKFVHERMEKKKRFEAWQTEKALKMKQLGLDAKTFKVGDQPDSEESINIH